jgi:hypothetical protein
VATFDDRLGCLFLADKACVVRFEDNIVFAAHVESVLLIEKKCTFECSHHFFVIFAILKLFHSKISQSSVVLALFANRYQLLACAVVPRKAFNIFIQEHFFTKYLIFD